MSVNTQHPEYAKHYPKWVMMRDALNDEVIKKGTGYLSKTPGMLALDREGLDPEQNVYCFLSCLYGSEHNSGITM